MPVYSGSFPLKAQGLAVTVTLNGTSLADPAPGVVGSTQTDDGALFYSYEYADGSDATVLSATVSSSLLGTLRTTLLFDASASIAAGGGGVVLGAWFSLSTGALVPDGTGQDVTLSVTTNDDLPPSDLVTITGGDGGTVAVVQTDGLYQFTVDGYAISVEAGITPITAAFATLNIDLNGDGVPVPLPLMGPAPCGLYPPGPNWRSTPMGISAPVTFRADDEISLTAIAEAFDSSDDPAIDGTFSVGGRLGLVRLGDIPA